MAPDEFEILGMIAEQLDANRIPWMLSGSLALGYYATPRMTRDIDIVVEMQAADLNRFVAAFQADFYLDREVIAEEIARSGMFNLIHNESVIKVDFMVRPHAPFHESAFSRRRRADISGKSIWMIAPEDLVIAKLLWSRESGSVMQREDVRLLLASSLAIDKDYISMWIEKLGLKGAYDAAKD